MFEPGTKVQWNAVLFHNEMWDFSGDIPKIKLPEKVKAKGTIVEATGDIVVYNGIEGQVFKVQEDTTLKVVMFHETQLEEISQ